MKKVNFRIGSSADTAYELKRTLELQLLYVSSLFSPPPKDAGEAIHKARQSYKKCRAILRLMRDSMGYAAYYRENTGLRDMQRELSQIRDSDVQYNLFMQLSNNYPEWGGKSWFIRITEDLRVRYDQELKSFNKTNKAADVSVSARLKAAQFQPYELNGDGFEIIEGGLFRIYRQGREMGKLIFCQDTDACEVHAFRKKAKYLQLQLTYLRAISKKPIKAMHTSLERLTENLGYYNDLHIACTSILEYAKKNDLSRKKESLLIGRLEEEMYQAKYDSQRIYEIVYAEKPKHFIKRIGRYWESYASR